MPPPTSISECLWVLGFALIAGTAQYLFGRSETGRSRAEQRFMMELARGKTLRTVDPAMVSDAVRDYSRSREAAFFCGVPWLGFVLGNIGVSLLRDAGFVIFPWIIMIPIVTYLVATTVVDRLKFQRLSRSLSPV